MTDQQRDELLLEIREWLERIEGKVDALDDRVSEVARAVRELGGDVADEPPTEATG
ncbi:MAG: hypothetical protein OXN24_02285 [Candidatus Dadabacteria bacterium]|nr:hypothetical protein [Candidatus Dadabacteria bacterium]